MGISQVIRQVGSCPLESPSRPCSQDQDAQRQGVNGSVLAEVEQVPESVMCGLELGEQITGRTVGHLEPEELRYVGHGQ